MAEQVNLVKKCLLFGKNQDMKILIKKEYFYASSKGTNSTDYCRQQHQQCSGCLYSPKANSPIT